MLYIFESLHFVKVPEFHLNQWKKQLRLENEKMAVLVNTQISKLY